MAKYVTCCKDCTNRFVGCHSVCETYKEQVEEYNKDKQVYIDSIQDDINYANYMKSVHRQRRIENNKKRRR